jgi:hypothetical protein
MQRNTEIIQLASKLESVKAEEFLNKFRSKEDIYRYLVQQGKLH